MRKYLSILFLLLWSTSVGAQELAWMNPYVAGGVVTAATNGTVGSTTHTATTYTVYSDRSWMSKFTSATAGTVRYGHVYVQDGGGYTITVALFSSAGSELLCCTVVATDDTPGWYNCDAGSSTTISNTTYYLHAGSSGGNITLGWASSSRDGVWYDASNAPGCGSTVTVEEVLVDADGALAIIWNNEASSPE